ncbi:MAG: 2-dehydropantoate 2-reductase [Candidatus Omnitrophica bacterium]|nr:2-dehydropantoate 2-reductase [Candidatus Omnitrophota bacterium]MDD3274332.1 2-dehydropantoate 2-reductase [Candidatus Omnitrophota bacterium]MDD5078141.1 2-dehydropantoate 2-reductase [Candidatus Omnitrophota bacterium]MDD5725237.1 2-dehydropantoate 2-reductase [Candidatus Omnitrophota bacterium]
MKIVVVGPGAIGCLFAAFLAKSKEEIWLLDKDKERAAKLNETGISLEGESGSWKIKVRTTSCAGEIGKADLILICVKSFHTKQASEEIKPLLEKDTKIITLQNGMGNIETISETAGEDRVIAGVTNEGATLIDTGKVRHAGRGQTIIGTVNGKTPVQMRSIREIFNKSGLECKMTHDIKSLLWSKLVINAGINALSALTRLPNGKLIEYEGTRRILRDTVAEAVRVAKRKRVKLIFDDPLAKAENVCEGTRDNLSSMLQDVLRKKRTEVEFINGVIVRLGQELGIAVPANKFLLDLVRTIESSYTQAAREKTET